MSETKLPSAQTQRRRTGAKLTKVDLRKQFKFLYSPSPKRIQLVDVPKMKFLMTDGVGDPNSRDFQSAIQTLYNLCYTIKFDLKMRRGIDYPVMALEGLWWIGDSAERFDTLQRDKWKWTLMIMQPDFVVADQVRMAAEVAKKKGKSLENFRLEEFREGLSAQTMHVGPYSTESSDIERIRSFMNENNYVQNGKHHEIYVGDPRRAAPSRLRTIIRQPIKSISGSPD